MTTPQVPAAGDRHGGNAPDLQTVHRRFGRAVTGLYIGTSAVAITLLVVSFLGDYLHEKEAARELLLLETDVRANYLSRHLQARDSF